jgi:hypothetical protein
LFAHPKVADLFYRRMADETSVHASSIGRLVNVRRDDVVVDIGGGFGGLLCDLTAGKGCRGILFDLPQVIEMARREPVGAISTCDLRKGDFFRKVPRGDVLILKGVLHDWDDRRALTVLRRCGKVLPASGSLYIIERLKSERGCLSDTILLDLHMLVMSAGRERSRAEFEELCSRAGFAVRSARLTKTGLTVMAVSKIF